MQKNLVRLPAMAGDMPVNKALQLVMKYVTGSHETAEKVRMCFIWIAAGFYTQSLKILTMG